MELWIRSQDKTMLCKPQYIELCCDSEVHYGDVNIGYRCVATYKTKERALEVLDEIQNILKPKIIIKNEGKSIYGTDGNIYTTNIVGNVNTDIQELSTYVYEMPEE